METVLHIGCHRTGSTTFQAYLRTHQDNLRKKGVVFWSPRRTRNGLFSGLIPTRPQLGSGRGAKRAEGRIRMSVAKTAHSGAKALLISDENMIGSVRSNLRSGALYPAIGERMARYAEAFDGRLTRVVLVIRGQDRYWTSAMSYGVARGHKVPSEQKRAEIAAGPRRWRDVITDLACAVPDVEINVIPFEAYCANPETLLGTTCKLPSVRAGAFEWLNRAPDLPALRGLLSERGDDPLTIPGGEGQWAPFTPAQTAHMQEQFEDDLFWLAAGAGGLATLTEQAMPGGRGKAHRNGTIRGRENDEEGSLEYTG